MKLRYRLLLFTQILAFSNCALAIDNKTWADISDIGIFTLIGSALIVPTASGDWEGLQQATYSMATAEAIVQFGKFTINEKRPDGSDNKSFPSGHAAEAFSAATTLYRRYGWEVGVPAYALATLTGSARVAARKHHWYDVVAGAAIGTASGWFFTDAFNDKVQIVPWADSKSVGVAFAMRW